MSLLSRVHTLRTHLSSRFGPDEAAQPADLATYAAILAAAKRERPRDALLIALEASTMPRTYGELDESYQRIALALEGAVRSP